MKERIVITEGDITQIEVDGIVNAANSALAGGGGVDGAIHRAAGPSLLKACKELGGCPTGEVRLTPAFQLPARYVLNAVGPVWQGGHSGEPQLLSSCYQNALLAAEQNGLKSLSFPAISCGVYGYPHKQAAEIAVGEVFAWLSQYELPEQVIFVLFDQEMAALYRNVLDGYL